MAPAGIILAVAPLTPGTLAQWIAHLWCSAIPKVDQVGGFCFILFPKPELNPVLVLAHARRQPGGQPTTPEVQAVAYEFFPQAYVISTWT